LGGYLTASKVVNYNAFKLVITVMFEAHNYGVSETDNYYVFEAGN
jgi:hypothetical protein